MPHLRITVGANQFDFQDECLDVEKLAPLLEAWLDAVAPDDSGEQARIDALTERERATTDALKAATDVATTP